MFGLLLELEDAFNFLANKQNHVDSGDEYFDPNDFWYQSEGTRAFYRACARSFSAMAEAVDRLGSWKYRMVQRFRAIGRALVHG